MVDLLTASIELKGLFIRTIEQEWYFMAYIKKKDFSIFFCYLFDGCKILHANRSQRGQQKSKL